MKVGIEYNNIHSENAALVSMPPLNALSSELHSGTSDAEREF